MTVVLVVTVVYENPVLELAQLTASIHRGAASVGHTANIVLVVNDDRPAVDFDGLGVTVVAGEGNVGFAAGVNRGIEMFEDPFIATINPDCLPDDAAFGAFINAVTQAEGLVSALLLDAHGEVDYRKYENWVFSIQHRIAEGRCRSFFTRGHEIDLPGWAKAPGTALGGARATVDALGGMFDSAFYLYGEDRELNLRARRAGVPIRVERRSGIRHVGGESGRDRPHLVSRAQADSAIRFAYRAYGPVGARVAMLDQWLLAALKGAWGRPGAGRMRSAARWAAARWRGSSGEAEPLNAVELTGAAP